MTAPIVIVSKDRISGFRKLQLVHENKPVGSAQLLNCCDTSATLESLFVAPDQRGKGYGRHLVAAAAQLAFASGASHLRLVCDDTGSGRLINWYRSMGFQPAPYGSAARPMLFAPANPARWQQATSLEPRS